MSNPARGERRTRLPRTTAQLLEELEISPPESGGRVCDVMLPVGAVIPSFATAESARRTLERDGLRFLLVVASGTGRLVGAVDRASLAEKDCCSAGNRPCRVVRHLAPDVAFCFGDESAAEVLEIEAELAEKAFMPRVRAIPRIVVNEQLIPLGIFDPGATVPLDATALSSFSPARAA
ncbi:MAG TPA: hypothetical protein VFS20_14670 [Longimicrobium sp.]|nr:hypothetical protein [Longimicrobium sp.]